MKKYWYAAVTADDKKIVIDSAKTLKELGENLGLGLHVVNYYYQNNLINKKLGVRFIRFPAITEGQMLQILKHGASQAEGSVTEGSKDVARNTADNHPNGGYNIPSTQLKIGSDALMLKFE